MVEKTKLKTSPYSQLENKYQQDTNYKTKGKGQIVTTRN